LGSILVIQSVLCRFDKYKCILSYYYDGHEIHPTVDGNNNITILDRIRTNLVAFMLTSEWIFIQTTSSGEIKIKKQLNQRQHKING
jgi:hypothetical protein